MNEPAINATIREYAFGRLKSGIEPKIVRASTVAAFVDSFALVSPNESFTNEYRKQVSEVVDAAIRSFADDSSARTPAPLLAPAP